MSSLPSGCAGRNWMMRRMLIEAIKADPAWNERQLHRRATDPEIHQRTASASRSAAAIRACTRSPRRMPRPTSTSPTGWRRSYCRRQQRHLRLRCRTRLQSGAGPGEDHRAAARGQLDRRRAQSARARHPGARHQAREEWQRLYDPRLARHPRPWHREQREAVEAPSAGSARRTCAGREVTTGHWALHCGRNTMFNRCAIGGAVAMLMGMSITCTFAQDAKKFPELGGHVEQRQPGRLLGPDQAAGPEAGGPADAGISGCLRCQPRQIRSRGRLRSKGDLRAGRHAAGDGHVRADGDHHQAADHLHAVRVR